MTRAILLAPLCVVALCGALSSASAAPLATAPPGKVTPLTQPVDHRRCYWDDGERVCRTYYDDEFDDYDDDDDADYEVYGAPGIYLGYGGYDHRYYGPHGHLHAGPGYFVHY